MFEICHIVNCVSLAFSAVYMMSIDLFLFGMTLYTCALYDEIIYDLDEIDSESNQSIAILQKARYQKLRKCVSFHVDTLKCVLDYASLFIYLINIHYSLIDTGNYIFNPILLMLFIRSIIILTACVLAANFVSLVQYLFFK